MAAEVVQHKSFLDIGRFPENGGDHHVGFNHHHVGDFNRGFGTIQPSLRSNPFLTTGAFPFFLPPPVLNGLSTGSPVGPNFDGPNFDGPNFDELSSHQTAFNYEQIGFPNEWPRSSLSKDQCFQSSVVSSVPVCSPPQQPHPSDTWETPSKKRRVCDAEPALLQSPFSLETNLFQTNLSPDEKKMVQRQRNRLSAQQHRERQKHMVNHLRFELQEVRKTNQELEW